jgi:hypothetical protein
VAAGIKGANRSDAAASVAAPILFRVFKLINLRQEGIINVSRDVPVKLQARTVVTFSGLTSY